MTEPSLVLTPHFESLADRYDVVLSDVWGVVHNGVEASLEACDALVRFRAQGKAVVLITNAPRPGEFVIEMLDRLNVPRDAYDGIVSSGDVSRAVIEGRSGRRLLHIGPERDLPIFDGLDAAFVDLERADYVVCTGLSDDETETAEDYRPLLTQVRDRGLFFLCCNPDKVVERGEQMLFCAGALADLYLELGGDVLFAGKPHPAIYENALAKAAKALGRMPDASRVIAIGDSVRTDLTGALAMGFDCLFVTSGIHAEELGGRATPDLALLRAMLTEAGVLPHAITRHLAW